MKTINLKSILCLLVLLTSVIGLSSCKKELKPLTKSFKILYDDKIVEKDLTINTDAQAKTLLIRIIGGSDIVWNTNPPSVGFITLDPETGTGSGALDVKVSANTTNASRESAFKFVDQYTRVWRTFTIIQAGLPE